MIQHPAEEIISFADTMPFLQTRENWLRIPVSFKSSQETLADYFPISRDTCMVFVESDVDKRSKAYKAIAKAGSAVDFSMPEERMLTG